MLKLKFKEIKKITFKNKFFAKIYIYRQIIFKVMSVYANHQRNILVII